jgi:6-phosphogluconate dehydrogenase (decarboxylating)
MDIGFIGLGVMGAPMAAHLHHRGGHKVTVYNRSPAKAAAWVDEHGGDNVRAVTIGEDGAFAAMRKGSVFIDHMTTSAQVARELHAIASEGSFGFVDAPVSGGQSGAENGLLTVICGGDMEDVGKAEGGTMLEREGDIRLERARLEAKAEEIDRKIHSLIALRDGLRHAVACPAPSHGQCSSFRRLMTIASKNAQGKSAHLGLLS